MLLSYSRSISDTRSSASVNCLCEVGVAREIESRQAVVDDSNILMDRYPDNTNRISNHAKVDRSHGGYLQF